MKGIPHVSNKKFTGAGLAIGAATAVTALLIGSTAAYAVEVTDGVASAFGIEAEGLVPIEATPFVVSENGELVEAEAANLEIAELLQVAAEDGRASANVVGVDVDGVLTADVVRTFCEDGEGGLQIVNGELLGQALPNDPIMGEEIDLSPLAKVTLGEETRNDDGSITVTGIKLTVLPVSDVQDDDTLAGTPLAGLLPTDDDTLGGLRDGLGLDATQAAQTVTIGSATCSEFADKKDDDKKDDDKKDVDKKDDVEVIDHCDDVKSDDVKSDDSCDDDDKGSDEPTAAGDAPAPIVVEANLPVTG